eukprot:scaffold482_cov266-Amphora_coffeaeformis.AAC.51
MACGRAEANSWVDMLLNWTTTPSQAARGWWPSHWAAKRKSCQTQISGVGWTGWPLAMLMAVKTPNPAMGMELSAKKNRHWAVASWMAAVVTAVVTAALWMAVPRMLP